jgi:hypothetical protein
MLWRLRYLPLTRRGGIAVISTARHLLLVVIGLVSLIGCSTSPGRDAPAPGFADSATTSALIGVEQRLNDAYLKKDSATIARILADEYKGTYGDGSQGNRRRELELLYDTTEVVQASALDEFEVRRYGEVVWVHLRASSRGRLRGKPFASAFRYSDLFVWRDGRWQCVASQFTRVTPN